jgi:hypothetical protein
MSVRCRLVSVEALSGTVMAPSLMSVTTSASVAWRAFAPVSTFIHNAAQLSELNKARLTRPFG